ncbi:hypothetical protein llap_10452 [Limosa lapponica baueri]|uniref:Uncharacterized protein n=1 Tax=Limosa lapponica baueri TaxID=1758121 RepID=A0A2I0TZJ5_LIMLA|nr:hypothetical protein llap_10452 [Limosa lapponica baueri]
MLGGSLCAAPVYNGSSPERVSLAPVPVAVSQAIPIPGHPNPLHDLLVEREHSQQYVRPKPEGHMITLAMRNCDALTGEEQMILYGLVEK